MIKLSDYVFQFVAEQGVKHVFMLPGGGAMHLNDSLGHCQEIEYICNQHEQACAIAAEAYARVTNNLGVALVTTGPGGTNAITGVAGAWLDSTPCLFISGQVKRSDIAGGHGLRQLGVQEINIISLVKPITKYAVTILDPGTIRYHLEKGISLARSGRPGPVWIDIPLDVQAANVDPENQLGFDAENEELMLQGNSIDEIQIAQVIESFNRAERPILLVGNGVRLAYAQQNLFQLVDLLGIPVLTTRLGVDLISASHELAMGMPGSIASRGANFALQNSDWLCILGARLDMALIAYAPDKLARAATKIMVNIDGAEIRKLGSAIDIAIEADAKSFICQLIDNSNSIERRDRSAWLSRCKTWQKQYPLVLDEHRAQNGLVSMYAFAEIMSEEIPKDAVVLPGSAGNASELFLTAFSVKAGQRVFHNKGTGAMGFCQPAAIGACLASGRKQTICIDGDGGFQMNIQELETVRRLDLPIKFFVMNNRGYASIRASQRNYFGRLTGADAASNMTLPDVVAIAKAFGIHGIRIYDSKNLREHIKQILAIPESVVCDVMIIPDEPRAPRVSSMQKPDGSMVSIPLEDMWPFLDRAEFFSNMIVTPLDE